MVGDGEEGGVEGDREEGEDDGGGEPRGTCDGVEVGECTHGRDGGGWGKGCVCICEMSNGWMVIKANHALS